MIIMIMKSWVRTDTLLGVVANVASHCYYIYATTGHMKYMGFNMDRSQKRIVEMLITLRNEKGISREKLSEGICTESMYARVEKGERILDNVTTNRFLSRLGVDQAKYEKFLDYTEYDRWKLRNDIINAIEDDRLKEAEEYLSSYETEDIEDGKVEKQLCLFMRAQILQHRGADDNEIFALYKEAVGITMPRIDEVKLGEMVLSVEELNLALEYKKRTARGQSADRIFSIYEEFFQYIAKAGYDTGVMVKIYPKVVVYLCNDVLNDMETVKEDDRKQLYTRLADLCHKAMELLMDDNTSFYMIELFEVYEKLLNIMVSVTKDENRIMEYKETIEQIKTWRETLKGVYEQYGVSPYMNDGCYLYREEGVHCINDVIRKRRKMKNMTEKELCDGICSERTVKRAERRETKLQKSITDELFEKLDMVAEYMNTGIITDSKEAVNIYEKYRKAINEYDMDMAEKLLDKLQEMLPEHPQNTQILMHSRSVINKKRGDISKEEHIEELKKVIRSTIDMDGLNDMEDVYLSQMENKYIYSIAITLKEVEKYDEACKFMDVLVKLCRNMEKEKVEDSFIVMNEVVMYAYANLIGSMGRYEESNAIAGKLIKLFLKLRRTNLLHLSMFNIAWNQKESDNNIEKYVKDIRRCMSLCSITKNMYYERCYKRELEQSSNSTHLDP